MQLAEYRGIVFLILIYIKFSTIFIKNKHRVPGYYQKVSKINLSNKILHILADILGLGLNFFKPIFARESEPVDLNTMIPRIQTNFFIFKRVRAILRGASGRPSSCLRGLKCFRYFSHGDGKGKQRELIKIRHFFLIPLLSRATFQILSKMREGHFYHSPEINEEVPWNFLLLKVISKFKRFMITCKN